MRDRDRGREMPSRMSDDSVLALSPSLSILPTSWFLGIKNPSKHVPKRTIHIRIAGENPTAIQVIRLLTIHTRDYAACFANE